MSCYVMSDFEFSALAYFINHHKLYRGVEGAPIDERRIAHLLYVENVKSYNYRYNETGGENETIQFSQMAYLAQYTPMQWIVGATCYQYQSCEHPGWKGSIAEKLTQNIIDFNLPKLEGFREAHWGLPEPKITRTFL